MDIYQRLLKSIIKKSLSPYLQDSDSYSFNELEDIYQQLYHKLKKTAYTLPNTLTTLERLLAGKNYGVQDRNSLYRVELTLLSLINEFDTEGRVLLGIVANTDSNHYIRNKAIKLLAERGDRVIILELVPLILDFQYSASSYNYHPNQSVLENFLEVLGELNLSEALTWIITLHNNFKASKLNNISLELDNETEKLAQSEQGEIDYHERPFIIVRARLGDIGVLESIIRLSYSDWIFGHKQASEALEQLERYVGRDAIVAQLLKQPTALLSDELETYWYLVINGEYIYIKRWALDQYLEQLSGLSLDVLTRLLSLVGDKTGYLRERVLDIVLKAPADLVLPVANQALTKSDYDLPTKYSLLYILLQLKQPIESWLTIISDVFIPLPDFIPNALRQSIINYWVPIAQPHSDIRWFIEYELYKDTYLLTEYDNEVKQIKSSDEIIPSGVRLIRSQVVETTINTSRPSYQAEVIVTQLVANLKTKGIAIDCYLDYADEMKQGHSTFYTIKMRPHINEKRIVENEDYKNYGKEFSYKLADNLNITKLGAYMYYSTYESEDYSYDNMPNGSLVGSTIRHVNEWNLASSPESLKIYQEEAEKLGLISLHNEVLDYIFPNLNIYFFGSRDPLPIRDLLFYWQD